MSQPTIEEVRQWFHWDFVKLHGPPYQWSMETQNAHTCQLAMLLRFVGWVEDRQDNADKQ